VQYSRWHVLRGTERREYQRDLIASTRRRVCSTVWGHVAVVERDQLDLSTIDAALVIDPVEIRDFRLAEHTVGGSGPLYGMVCPIRIRFR